MNLLTERLPDSLVIAGRELAINTDFRLMVRLELLLTEGADDLENELAALLAEFMPEIDNTLPQEAFTEALMQYYACGKVSAEDNEDDGENDEPGYHERIYSFLHDSAYIYAAFVEAYGIDLTEAALHWYQFRALFNALPQSCFFSRILGWRGMEITSAMSSEQKDFYRKMKRRFALPLPKSEQEKTDAITAALLNGGDLSGVL